MPTIHNFESTLPPCVTNIKLDTDKEKYTGMPSTIIEFSKLQVNNEDSYQ